MGKTKFQTKNVFKGKRRRSKETRGRKKTEVGANKEPKKVPVARVETTTKRKLKAYNVLQTNKRKLGVDKSETNVNAIINFDCINNIINERFCPKCNAVVDIKCMPGKIQGLAMYMEIVCSICSAVIKKGVSTPRLDGNSSKLPFEINRRSIIATRLVGLGPTGLNKMLGALNIAGKMHHKTFSRVANVVHQNVKYIATIECLEQAHQLVKKTHADLGNSGDVIDISVSSDCTWQKRGFTSLYGAVFVMETLTGLILDFEILSKYCLECEVVGGKLVGDEKLQWEKAHEGSCHINYKGSSPAMESEAAVRLWSRSTDLGFRYTELISDGDSKTFPNLVELNPYGDEHPITKQECINHVQKRMFTGLEKLAQQATANKISVRGRGKLTKERMKRWSNYYRNAILNNAAKGVSSIQDEIWAILFHSCSTAEKPHHTRCGEDWCFFKIAQREQRDPEEFRREKQLDPPLAPEIGELCVPLFRRLTATDLLERCVQLETQNRNESLHSVVWRKIPKITFVTLPTLEIGICMAVCEFNKGATTICDMLSAVGIEPGPIERKLVKTLDDERLRGSKRKSTNSTKEARKQKKLIKIRDEEAKKRKEGGTYGAGEF